jgi:hypothetical protein
MAQSSDERLRQVIHEMAEGPGQSPLDAIQLEKETAYHRSLLDGKPFLVLTGNAKDGDALTLSGEVTPESKVEVCLDKTTLSATVTEHQWKAVVSADLDLSRVMIIATKGEAKTEIKTAEGFSHKAAGVTP